MRKNNWKSATRSGWTLAIVLFSTVLMTQSAPAQSFNVIYTFTGGLDGANPYVGLTIDRAGNLYGTALNGGAGFGTVYKLSHHGSGWTFNPVYTFAGGSDGAGPAARVSVGCFQCVHNAWPCVTEPVQQQG